MSALGAGFSLSLRVVKDDFLLPIPSLGSVLVEVRVGDRIAGVLEFIEFGSCMVI
jgi:hypothetical protein